MWHDMYTWLVRIVRSISLSYMSSSFKIVTLNCPLSLQFIEGKGYSGFEETLQVRQYWHFLLHSVSLFFLGSESAMETNEITVNIENERELAPTIRSWKDKILTTLCKRSGWIKLKIPLFWIHVSFAEIFFTPVVDKDLSCNTIIPSSYGLLISLNLNDQELHWEFVLGRLEIIVPWMDLRWSVHLWIVEVVCLFKPLNSVLFNYFSSGNVPNAL